MHTLLIATFNKNKAKNSVEARKYTSDFLVKHYEPLVEADGSVYGEYIKYKSALYLVDWFAIGGRWSSHLLDLHDIFWEQLKNAGLTEFSEWSKSHILKNESDVTTPIFQTIWETIGGKGRNPFVSNWTIEGQDQDAMLVTQHLYDRLLKQFEGKSDCDCSSGGFYLTAPAFADLDEEQVTPDFIGKKWIVVVDCHE